MGKRKKGMGGNARQRAMAQGANNAVPPPPAQPAVPLPHPPDPPPNRLLRLFEFFEHPWFLWSTAVVAAAVGLVLYTPAFVVMALCFAGAFHRSKVVDGLSWKVQILAYIGIVSIAFGISWVGVKAARKVSQDLAKLIADDLKALVAPAPKQPPPQRQPVRPANPGHVGPTSKGDVEVFFEDGRGEQVSFKTPAQMQSILADTTIKAATAKSDHTVTVILTAYASDKQVPFTFSVRNTSNTSIKNATITVASNRMLLGTVGSGMRILTRGEREYDVGEIKPFKETGAEDSITLELPADSSAFAPQRILVTVDGSSMAHPHSEAVNVAITRLPFG